MGVLSLVIISQIIVEVELLPDDGARGKIKGFAKVITLNVFSKMSPKVFDRGETCTHLWTSQTFFLHLERARLPVPSLYAKLS